jgi:hypothetical protein
MSNVLERHRGISEMEFYRTAINIRHELTTFLMREKNVPKRWRSIYAYPIINASQAQIDLIVKANNIYPFKEEQVEERKHLQQGCIDYCDIIFERLQALMQDLWWDMLHRDNGDSDKKRIQNFIDSMGCMLVYEEDRLKGWRKSTKLLRR